MSMENWCENENAKNFQSLLSITDYDASPKIKKVYYLLKEKKKLSIDSKTISKSKEQEKKNLRKRLSY